MKLINPLFKQGKIKAEPDRNSLYYKYLNNQSFRGFYYDAQDASYGIVLEFGKHLNGRLNLFAQVAKGNMNILEYQIQCDTYSFETVAYDKVLINSSSYNSNVVIPESFSVDIPQNIEFFIQVLTRNSVYIRFSDSEKYSAPISSFKGGLVLAREQQKATVKADQNTIESDLLMY